MYLEVLLPTLKSSTAQASYTYECPADLTNKLAIGQLVSVPFGRDQKPAIIKQLNTPKPDFATKPITEILIENPILSTKAIALAEQMATYYFATPHRCLSLSIAKKILSKNWQPKRDKETELIKLSSFLKKMEKQDKKKHSLTNEQQEIVKSISPNINKQESKSHLIIGPTGSGKTEVYLQLAQQLTAEQQGLLLVPEIALTPQLAQYFYNHFGDKIVVWHSELSDGEKRNAWWRIKTGEAQFVIGSRSSLFLPYDQLGVVIIDEEQAQAFKQDQTPRYHARTVSQWLSKLHGCPLILGTATPSLETYQASLKDRIQLHRLSKRIHNTAQPEIKIIDMKEEVKKGNFSIFSETLLEQIEATINQDKQVLLFLNRRGYASSLQCFECGEISLCNNCDISLTVHGNSKPFMQCHLCGQTYNLPTTCPNCRSRKIKNLGLGTQQVEAEIAKLLPTARILRADRDTTSTKHSFHEIYTKFRNHEADILIGTQMISKGLHLPKVDLVGVMLADIGLHIPDFRANERAFQLLTQVCGRAGRGKTQGQVVIQTLSPKHPVLTSLGADNIEEFYTKELLIRNQHNYPPNQKITKLTCTDPREHNCLSKAQAIETTLINSNIEHLGAPASIFRQHNKYHYNIILFNNSPESIIKQLNLDPSWRIDRDPLETS